MSTLKKFFFVLLLIQIILLTSSSALPVQAASQSWDGNYEAEVDGTCDPWIVMDSWVVAGNSIVTPYGAADIDDEDQAHLRISGGGIVLEDIYFNFSSEDGTNTFSANWAASEYSDGSGDQCSGTLYGTCVSGCGFGFGFLSGAAAPPVVVIGVAAVIGGVVFCIILIVGGAALIRALTRPRIPAAGARAPFTGAPGTTSTQARDGVTRNNRRRKKTAGPRKFRPVYGKKIFKPPKSPSNSRLQY